jgi:putative Ca2+/H+ antiporter (TMEM165/GDT1 family)
MTWQWSAFLVTFWTVFVAELGDKTQIATLNFAAKGHSFISVFAGSALALVVASFLGTAFGAALGEFINPLWLNRGAGALFIVLGVLVLLNKM